MHVQQNITKKKNLSNMFSWLVIFISYLGTRRNVDSFFHSSIDIFSCCRVPVRLLQELGPLHQCYLVSAAPTHCIKHQRSQVEE